MGRKRKKGSRRTKKIYCCVCTEEGEEQLEEEVAVEHLDGLVLGLVLLLLVEPSVRVVLVDVVVEHVVSSMGKLPGVKGHEDRPVRDVAHNIIEELIVREGGVSAVVPDHENTPHKETFGMKKRIRG